MRLVLKRPDFKPFLVETTEGTAARDIRLLVAVPPRAAIHDISFGDAGVRIFYSCDKRLEMNYVHQERESEETDTVIRGIAVFSRVVGGKHVEMRDEHIARIFNHFVNFDLFRFKVEGG